MIYVLTVLVVLVLALNLYLLKILNTPKQDNQLELEFAKMGVKFDSLVPTLREQSEGIFGTKLSDYQVKFSEQIGAMSEKINMDLIKFKEAFSKGQREEFDKLSQHVETRLEKISNKVQENLDEGFKKTNTTFTSIVERLAKIDEAQKKIEALSNSVVDLQSVLTDKKSRGIFGEVQLHHVLASVFGDKNENVYKLQHSLSNKTIVDSMLFLPEPTGAIAVDSKFPLENFRRLVDKSLSDEQRSLATKEFKKNLKKHISDIAEKYIIKGETSDQAILFLPAEAIFAEIHAYHSDIIDFSQKNKVWIVSPTTFVAMLTTIQVVLNNIERSKYTSLIHEELNKLGMDFKRYRERWDKLSKHMDTVTKDVKDIHTSTQKITTKFDNISEVNLPNHQKLSHTSKELPL